MTEKEIFQSLKHMGCCDACCLRYLVVKNSSDYENIEATVKKYADLPKENCENSNDQDESNIKKIKISACIACLGILQKETWDDTITMLKTTFEKNNYDCQTFACGLSAPVCLILRTRAIYLYLNKHFPNRANKSVLPLKEAWKYMFMDEMSKAIGKTADAGNISPLLVTCNFSYEHDFKEMHTLSKIIPEKYHSDKKRKDFFSRNNIEKLTADLTIDKMANGFDVPPNSSDVFVKCQSIDTLHTPIYLGGRYIKLKRGLSQTPWFINGVKYMETSVQDIIFEPVAKLFGFDLKEAATRMKFISAGREDVDVRCLGSGRPFALDVLDPHITKFTPEQLQQVCDEICKSELVLVKELTLVDRDQLTYLKQGEESKTKTYEALCIKLTNGKKSQMDSQNGCQADLTDVRVADEDLEAIRKCKMMTITQNTPLRVLHRRPLLARDRIVYEMDAQLVKDHPNLFKLTLKTQAGTYVKEFIHGDFGRTTPSLSAILNNAQTDILALDVTKVDLDWPVLDKTVS